MGSGAVSEPGSDSEHLAQDQFRTRERALRFYADQLLDRLSARMIEFVQAQTQVIIASADSAARPDASVRFGEPGFVRVLTERVVCWPELRGNGVLTTLGNIVENPAVHLMFLDHDERIGLHLRGTARIVEAYEMAQMHPDVAHRPTSGRPPERWVVVDLVHTYIHCRKHFPRSEAPTEWGTNDVRAKGGDYFGAKGVATPWAPDPSAATPLTGAGGQPAS